MICYGLDNFSEVHRHVTANQLQKLFPNVPLSESVRPREIHLLVSQNEGQLDPQRACIVSDLVLWDGPLWKTAAGSDRKQLEEIAVSAHMSRTHFARSVRTAAVKYE